MVVPVLNLDKKGGRAERKREEQKEEDELSRVFYTPRDDRYC